MGNSIRVDHSVMRSTASSLRSVADGIIGTLNQTIGQMDDLSSSWQGSDYDTFIGRAHALRENDSSIVSTSNTIRQYADWLENAANMYQQAQAQAINKSLSL